MTDNYIQKALERDSAWLDIESAEEGTRVLQKNGNITNIGRISKNTPDDYKAQSYAPLNAPDLLFAEVKRLREKLNIAVDALKNAKSRYYRHDVIDNALKQIGDL